MARILPAILPLVFWLSAQPDVPARLLQYEVSESRKITSARGPSVESVSGTVVVAGGKSRWTVTHGTFPRSSVSAVISSPDGFSFLSSEDKLAALGSREDFDSLFKGNPASEAGGLGTFSYDEIECQIIEKTKEPATGSLRAATFEINASWVLKVLLPGRSVSIRNRISGTLGTSRQYAAWPTPFDDPLRLLPLRGTAAEKIRREIEKLEGKIVTFHLEMTSEQTGLEGVGGEAPAAAPARSSTTIERKTSGFLERAQAKGEDSLFAIPEDYKLRSPERILKFDPALR
ncbi:MAG: hypothetical protein DIJKHBIC_02857 [Thermoanaerobaculia bacterium]|nr:hypothetical protein [Thermoanaerobaculia bacterium]